MLQTVYIAAKVHDLRAVETAAVTDFVKVTCVRFSDFRYGFCLNYASVLFVCTLWCRNKQMKGKLRCKNRKSDHHPMVMMISAYFIYIYMRSQQQAFIFLSVVQQP